MEEYREILMRMQRAVLSCTLNIARLIFLQFLVILRGHLITTFLIFYFVFLPLEFVVLFSCYADRLRDSPYLALSTSIQTFVLL